MSVITVFNALYCNEELIVPQLVAKTGYRLVNDSEISPSSPISAPSTPS